MFNFNFVWGFSPTKKYKKDQALMQNFTSTQIKSYPVDKGLDQDQ